MNGTPQEGTKGIGPKEVTNASKLVGGIGSQDTVRSRRDCAFARGAPDTRAVTSSWLLQVIWRHPS
eukprot:339706-Rhodomonas_salina.1